MANQNFVNRSKSSDKIDFDNPPAGKVYVAIPTDEDDIKRAGIDRRFVAWRRFSATYILCKMVLIDKDAEPIYKSYHNEIKVACKKKERENRCMITSPKKGKKIPCPERFKCGTKTCPRRDSMMEEAETKAPLSYEKWMEDSGNELSYADTTSSVAIVNVDRELFCKKLKVKNPMLEKVFLLEYIGYEADEIIEKLNIKKSRYYELRKTIQRMYNDFFQD